MRRSARQALRKLSRYRFEKGVGNLPELGFGAESSSEKFIRFWR
jgi:hypothetical protein